MADKSEKFWERVTDRITLEGISVLKLCEKLDINYQTFKTSQSRKQIPSAEIILKLADHFGMSMEYFLTGKDPWTRRPDADVRKVAMAAAILDADDETVTRVKALLEADRKMLEERKLREQDADTLQVEPHPRKRGGKAK